MARIRTIKPEFFRHAALFDAEIETGLPLRVAFAGLWTACDRSGRFAWKPRELKLDCLPFDECDFSRVLDALATRGFVSRYVVDGVAFGFVPSWDRHQIINNRESQSSFPEPTEESIESMTCTREARVDDASATRHGNFQGEGKGKEGKGREVATTTAVAVAPSKAGDKTEKPKTRETWQAYSDAYESRYSTKPVANAKVNGQLSQLVSRLGAEEAPKVARWYVGLDDPFYSRQMHSVDSLLADAEKLRTRWATGRSGSIAPAMTFRERDAIAARAAGDVWMGSYAKNRNVIDMEDDHAGSPRLAQG
jgi:hypothetical protein